MVSIALVWVLTACMQEGAPEATHCRDILGDGAINRDALACTRSGYCMLDGETCCMPPIGGAASDERCGFPEITDCCDAWSSDEEIQSCMLDWMRRYSANTCERLSCGSPTSFTGYACRDGSQDCSCE